MAAFIGLLIILGFTAADNVRMPSAFEPEEYEQSELPLLEGADTYNKVTDIVLINCDEECEFTEVE